MGKKSILVIIVLLMQLSTVCAQSYPNEPDGFRGMKWGSTISELSNDTREFSANFHSIGGTEVYKIENDNLQIGGTKMDSILYSFYEGKLITTQANLTSKSFINYYFNKISKSASSLWGPPHKNIIEDGTCVTKIWNGDKTTLTIAIYGDSVITEMRSTYLYQKLQEDMRNEVQRRESMIDTSGW